MTGYREKALAEYERICHICGADGEVEVHHRNGDRDDNRISNLIPVCPDCHKKIHARSDDVPEFVRELGYVPRPQSGKTTIQVSDDVYNELTERKREHETYGDLLYRLEEQAGHR